MLNPQDRLLYLEALRPPAGYKLDSAVATTFSLDLLSLLMAPLSMIFSEQGGQEQFLKDPIAFLEAVRRIKDRLLVFCQVGRISVPNVDTRLYSYLEPVVTEVQPPGTGVFHPKLWFLRFVSEANKKVILYRLLCLSRNLTFDHSWDTLLSLEGHLADHRRQNYSLNRPLIDFVKTLPTLAQTPISKNAKTLLDQMINEIGRVQFEPPTGFEEIVAFRPVGINGYKRFKFPDTYRRLLVVSPFLTNSRIKQLLSQGSDNVLISRAESLDDLSLDTLAQIQINTSLYALDETAERPEIEELGTDQAVLASEDLSGLHAKLYVAETGWDTTVLTGSANVSEAAFLGHNIEFMVELKGKRSQVGIQALLGNSAENTSLINLLEPYQRSGRESEVLVIQQKLETALNEARQALIRASLRLTVTPTPEDTFALALRAQGSLNFDDDTIRGKCYPISRRRDQSLDIVPLLVGNEVLFTNVSMTGLTSFVAFELTASLENQQATLSFVLNLPVTGIPDERDQVILHSIIADKNHFIRYLLFLLAEDKEFSLFQILQVGDDGKKDSGSNGYLAGLPLLEELVRAVSRQPQKIDHIAALVESLWQTEGGPELLPEGFNDIWDAFLANRRQGQRK